MEHKILEANGVENENVDGAAFNNFSAHDRTGILKGVLNECSVYLADSTTVVVDTGELLIHGFRVKITSPYSVKRTASASNIRYQIVARITLSSDRSVSFVMDCRSVTALRQDSIFVTESGAYEIELAQFTTGIGGISNLTRTANVVGSNSLSEEEKSAIIAELQRYIDEEILNGEW